MSTPRSVSVIQSELADVRRYLAEAPPHSGHGVREDLGARVTALERELSRVGSGTSAAADVASAPLSHDEVEAYLTRIGYRGRRDTSSETLTALQRAHALAVPFENLDIVDGIPLDLGLPALVDKVVTRRRGGFCYELNGLFAALLRSLGFEVDLVNANLDPDDSPGSAFDHAGLLVTVDGGDQWLADVGNGASWLAPMPLAHGATMNLGNREILLSQDGDAWLTSQRATGETAWTPEWRFATTPRRLADFAERCRWQETSPTSHFAQGLICTRPIDGGKVTLTADRLIVTQGTDRDEQPIDDVDEILLTHFGIQR